MNKKRKKKNKKPFKDKKEIEESIFDLAGVRIALYVPNQKETVRGLINELFEVVHWQDHGNRCRSEDYICTSCSGKLDETRSAVCQKASSEPEGDEDQEEEPKDDYSPIFAGYAASHARVKLKKNDLPRDIEDDLGPDKVVEIQVVSVLVHAWAEVEHDIVYKAIKDEASVEEKKILDTLNGMIMSAELLLDQLHTTHNARVNNQYQAFRHKTALATYVNGYVETLLSEKEINDLHFKMLLQVLRVAHKDSRQKLGPILKQLGFDDNTRGYSDASKTKLRTNIDNISDSVLPFRLAKHMEIPFYIMRHILPDKETPQDPHRGSRSHADRCCVLLSCMVWLVSLVEYGRVKRVKDAAKLNESEDKAWEWTFIGVARGDIAMGEKNPNTKDEKDMKVLWDWFEKQERSSIFSFVFRASKLGVLRSFPEDLPRKSGHGNSED
ncbi:hypothetical protein BCR34DRAFT_667741 [Clohesyomyces aquaticus]|uniref:RelA/SpoT domain-containing protein n=1 Tax=Clohesyomyces aquaticus TaxID=1231657 RepID=A0A1Y1YWQ4_9PLEO|nr:hypothetical protein BCR34DRAFT_667741 [Clohesyomyces aquaticus]